MLCVVSIILATTRHERDTRQIDASRKEVWIRQPNKQGPEHLALRALQSAAASLMAEVLGG